MRFLLVLLVLTSGLLAQEQAAKSSAPTQTTGNCGTNIVNNGSGPVTVVISGSCNATDRRLINELKAILLPFISQNPKTIGYLEELLDQKNAELARKASDIKLLIQNVNELKETVQQLKNGPAEDELRGRAADALDRGDLKVVNGLLKDVKNLQAAVESQELAGKAEELIVEAKESRRANHNLSISTLNQARFEALRAWLRAHTEQAKKAVVDSYSLPVVNLGEVSSGISIPASSAVFSPDGARILASQQYGTFLYDAVTGTTLTGRLEDGRRESLSSAFSRDGKFIVAVDNDNSVRVWDAKSRTPLGFQRDQSKIRAVFSEETDQVASVALDGTVIVWDPNGTRPTVRMEGSTGSKVGSLAFSPDGKKLLTTGGYGPLTIWDATTGLQKLQLEKTGPDTAEFSRDSRRILGTGGSRRDGVIWDAVTGEKTCTETWYSVSPRFSPDNESRLFIIAGNPPATFDTATCKQLHLFEGHNVGGQAVPVKIAEFSNDGNRVLTVGSDMTVRVWDTVTGNQLAKLSGSCESFNSASFSPDGKWIVTTGAGCSSAVYLVVPANEVDTMVSK